MEALQIGYLVTGIIMFLFSGLLTWTYMKDQSNIDAFKSQGDAFSGGSYKGWWYRYKYSAIIFGAFTFLIIGISMTYVAFV